jgi:Dynamin central region
MHRPQSITLVVVSANYGFALQEITELAREADPEGVRTKGLITKSDTLHAGSHSEQSWIQVASNRNAILAHGWHILKNRSWPQRRFTSGERDTDEVVFFSQGVWESMENCAAKGLRTRLSLVLKQQIPDQLPSLIADIEKGVESCSERLSAE